MATPFAVAVIRQAAETLEATAAALESKLVPGQDKANFSELLQINEARRVAIALRTLLDD